MNLNIQFCLVLIVSFLTASTSGCSTVPMTTPSPQPVVMVETPSIVSDQAPRRGPLSAPTVAELEEKLKIYQLQLEISLLEDRRMLEAAMSEAKVAILDAFRYRYVENVELGQTLGSHTASELMAIIRTFMQSTPLPEQQPITTAESK